MSTPPASTHLPHGHFLGDALGRAAVSGFEFAHLRATVPCAEVTEHTHPEAHFVLVLSGDYVTSAAGAPPVCRGPALIYNPPGTTHRDRFADDGRFFAVSVGASALEDFPDQSLLPDRALMLDGAALALAQRLAREVGRNADHPPPAAEGLATELLAVVAGAREANERAAPGWLARVRDRLHADSQEGHSLAMLAHEAGVHPFHVTRAFRRHYGITPGEFVRRRRLGRAADRLVRTRDPLADIALDCGFYDQAHFSRCFRAAFGETPCAYRRWRS